METQRVNCYISGSDTNVFYIEQFDPKHGAWFEVGDRYENIKIANTMVEKHNLVKILDKITYMRDQEISAIIKDK